MTVTFFVDLADVNPAILRHEVQRRGFQNGQIEVTGRDTPSPRLKIPTTTETAPKLARYLEGCQGHVRSFTRDSLLALAK